MAVKGLIKKVYCCAVYQDVKKEEQQRTEQEDDRFSSTEKHYTILSGKHETGMSTQPAVADSGHAGGALFITLYTRVSRWILVYCF